MVNENPHVIIILLLYYQLINYMVSVLCVFAKFSKKVCIIEIEMIL